MKIEGWKYYNHAAIPTTAPHIQPDLTPIKDKSIWKMDCHPLFARWTEDFDCEKETNWWYVICDKPFEVSSLNSKKRNIINNGYKYCDVKECNPLEYEESLFEVYDSSQKSYGNKGNNDKLSFHNYLLNIIQNISSSFYCCFLKENRKLIGYAVVVERENYCELQSQKALPLYEKYQVNAALVSSVLDKYKEKISKSFYICDGSRNINHETKFQDYLEKYFGFRKAYCKLKLVYSRKIKWMIQLFFPFRKLLKKMDKIKIVHKINGVLKMEEIVRQGE